MGEVGRGQPAFPSIHRYPLRRSPCCPAARRRTATSDQKNPSVAKLMMEVEMAILRTLEFEQTTSTELNAGTDDSFVLHISGSGRDAHIPFFDQAGVNEREEGQTDNYEFDIDNWDFDSDDITLSVQTRGDDRWLPASFEVIGNLDSGGSVTLIDRTWPSNNYFSTDHNEGQSEYTL
jgi:hypothetical protein